MPVVSLNETFDNEKLDTLLSWLNPPANWRIEASRSRLGVEPDGGTDFWQRTHYGFRAGNGHLRRLLIEAAWHHRKPYRPTKTMQTRWDQAPPAARARGDKGNRRLHRRWAGFDARSKKPTVANTAIARELAGWCWSLATLE